MLPLTPILRQIAERVTTRLDTGTAPYSEQEEIIFAGSDFVAEQCIRIRTGYLLCATPRRNRMNGAIMPPGWRR